MDFQTVLSYVVAIVETAALLGALVFLTRAMHEKKIKRTRQGKKGGESNEVIEKTVAKYTRTAGIFFLLYLALNIFRLYSGVFE